MDLGLIFAALYAYFALLALTFHPATATNTPLIIIVMCFSVATAILWLFHLSTLKILEQAPQLDGADAYTYDMAGDWFFKLDLDREALQNSSYAKGKRCFTRSLMKNQAILKVVYDVKYAMSFINLACDIGMGIIIDGLQNVEGYAQTMAILRYVALASVGVGVFDGIFATAIGADRSPFYLLAKHVVLARKHGSVEAIPFQPFLSTAALCQSLIVNFELQLPMFLIPILHSAYGINTTSTWLTPIACKFIFTIYMFCAIHWKFCPAAFFVGLAIEAGILKKPSPFHLGYATPIVMKACSLSCFGPIFQYDEYTSAQIIANLAPDAEKIHAGELPEKVGDVKAVTV